MKDRSGQPERVLSRLVIEGLTARARGRRLRPLTPAELGLVLRLITGEGILRGSSVNWCVLALGVACLWAIDGATTAATRVLGAMLRGESLRPGTRRLAPLGDSECCSRDYVGYLILGLLGVANGPAIDAWLRSIVRQLLDQWWALLALQSVWPPPDEPRMRGSEHPWCAVAGDRSPPSRWGWSDAEPLLALALGRRLPSKGWRGADWTAGLASLQGEVSFGLSPVEVSHLLASPLAARRVLEGLATIHPVELRGWADGSRLIRHARLTNGNTTGCHFLFARPGQPAAWGHPGPPKRRKGSPDGLCLERNGWLYAFDHADDPRVADLGALDPTQYTAPHLGITTCRLPDEAPTWSVRMGA